MNESLGLSRCSEKNLKSFFVVRRRGKQIILASDTAGFTGTHLRLRPGRSVAGPRVLASSSRHSVPMGPNRDGPIFARGRPSIHNGGRLSVGMPLCISVTEGRVGFARFVQSDQR